MGEIREMTDKELDAVNGGKAHGGVSGKLFEQCCKGTHLPEVIIE
jgi:bacteriocin-like protein